MAPRILYLHGLRSKPGDVKHKLLQSIYGESVTAPNLKTRQFTVFAILLGLLQLVSAVLLLVTAVKRLPGWAAIVATVILLIGFFSLSMLLFRSLAAMCVARAVRIATGSYDTLQPNVIVADGFGSVVARRIARPKPAVMMFRPLLEKYARWSGDRSHRRLDTYPYVLLIDESQPLPDTYRTLERADPDRCKLELLEYSQSQQKISEEEMKSFVEECIEGGKRGAKELATLDPHAAISVGAF